MYKELNDKIVSALLTLKGGLQQWAANSPVLFNVYISDVLRAYYININNNDRALGFADNIISYTFNDCLFRAQSDLQDLFVKIKKITRSLETEM